MSKWKEIHNDRDSDTKDNNERVPLFEEDLKYCCYKYSSGKKGIVNIMQCVFRVPEEQYGLKNDIQYPSLDFADETERQLFLLRFFRPDEEHISEDALNDEEIVGYLRHYDDDMDHSDENCAEILKGVDH